MALALLILSPKKVAGTKPGKERITLPTRSSNTGAINGSKTGMNTARKSDELRVYCHEGNN
jgi:hypothetical protein